MLSMRRPESLSSGGEEAALDDAQRVVQEYGTHTHIHGGVGRGSVMMGDQVSRVAGRSVAEIKPGQYGRRVPRPDGSQWRFRDAEREGWRATHGEELCVFRATGLFGRAAARADSSPSSRGRSSSRRLAAALGAEEEEEEELSFSCPLPPSPVPDAAGDWLLLLLLPLLQADVAMQSFARSAGPFSGRLVHRGAGVSLFAGRMMRCAWARPPTRSC